MVRILGTVTFLCVGLFCGAARSQEAAAKGTRPNIIFILADDLGYGHLGCYGQKKIRTPHVDEMAAEGVRCTQFYVGDCQCAPSRCVFMTGLHNGHGSIRGNSGTGVFAYPPEKVYSTSQTARMAWS